MTGFSDITNAIANLLSSATPSGSLDNTITNTLNELNEKSTAIEDENNKTLSNQESVKKILDAENERIQTNIQTIDDSLTTQRRMVEFNDNMRLRTEQYNQILIIFVAAVCLILAIVIGFSRLPFLPDFISQGLIVIIGSITFIKIFKLYVSIQDRSIVNYNELDLDKPARDSPATIAAKRSLASKTGDLLGTIDLEGCRGPACCDTTNGVKWDDVSRKCIKESFTVERLKYNQSSVLPNSASEVNLYSKL